MFVPSVALNLLLLRVVRAQFIAVVNPWSKRKGKAVKGGSCSVASQLGKRYRCQVCGTEVLCVKAGEGVDTCCGQEMEVQEPRPIPSSD